MTTNVDHYRANDSRYEQMLYRRCGASGLDLPAISLGLWHNFGDDVPMERQRAILRRAFDRGVTHFDLANKGGGSRKYLLASLDQSLKRMGLDYVDIFYSHRFDETTPLEETMGALDTAVRSGRALYAGISSGISSYSGPRTIEAIRILQDLGTPLLIHQPSYSMLNRWVEEGLLDVLGDTQTGCIAFSPLAQGMLTDKYLDGIPEGSRAAQGKSLDQSLLTQTALKRIRSLNQIAADRGQSLAQMALAWTLRDHRITSVLVGASRVEQLDNSLDALNNLQFTTEELTQIDAHAIDSGINIWARSSSQ